MPLVTSEHQQRLWTKCKSPDVRSSKNFIRLGLKLSSAVLWGPSTKFWCIPAHFNKWIHYSCHCYWQCHRYDFTAGPYQQMTGISPWLP